MRIKDMNLSQLNNVLNELYKLQGAKEVFKKFNIELINKETELQGITDLVNSISKFFKENKETKEFLQVFNFMNQEIEMKKKMIESAEGMMKQLLNMQITSSEQSLNMIEKQTKDNILPELLKLVKENIINEEDLSKVETLIKNNNLNNLSLENTYSEIKLEIENRYSKSEENNEYDTKEEKEVIVKENNNDNKKEENIKNVEEEKNDIKEKKLNKELDEDNKKSKETKEDNNNIELDFGNFNNSKEENKTEVKEYKEEKEETKEEKIDEEIDFFNDDDFKEFNSGNNNDDLGFGFSLSNDDGF